MTTDQPESSLEVAARQVAEGRRKVAEQKAKIVKLKAGGLSTAEQERTLRVFESALRAFEQHEGNLRRANRTTK